jgi:catechol 2,3-dioxygenase-like lactoylglutathione lyase family enzyme
MRLDHIAYRVRDRRKAADFFASSLGYTTGTEFQIEFDDGSTASCLALVPPEKRPEDTKDWSTWKRMGQPAAIFPFHASPEIFVSDGPKGSIVGDWVKENGPGVHHIAYQVDDVEAKMKEWLDNGYAEFYSDRPLECEGLIQVFTKPSELTGVIYELINRTDKGFCEDNVKGLMESTKQL